MALRVRMELYDDETKKRVDGFEVSFESREMAMGLLGTVRKNVALTGREAVDLAAAPAAAAPTAARFEKLREKLQKG
ncbi:MAG: hypothetical protein HY558_06760 [Euryarchaeota archaeon]|nr:hypothetical protein [Euryarchaeota archaeon]